jgi:hypothetical protein
MELKVGLTLKTQKMLKLEKLLIQQIFYALLVLAEVVVEVVDQVLVVIEILLVQKHLEEAALLKAL